MEDNINNRPDTDGESDLSQFISQPQEMKRPKLKKIKRPKVRLSNNDVPTAPDKVMPDFSLGSVAASSQSNNSVADYSASQHNDLITSFDIHSISQESDYNNPYVLDALPPELDYETNADGSIGYHEDRVSSRKKLMVFSIACFFIGLFIGAIFFSSRKEVKYGLEGVVLNSDVPKGRPRCGLTEPSQACVFYIMNWYKRELNGRDFYDLAAKLTGRSASSIASENMRYDIVKIKPGHFVQLNIPAL